jgi:hypothetical protein
MNWLLPLALIALGLIGCWRLYLHQVDRHAEREADERRKLQEALLLAHGEDAIARYWAARGQVIKPLATRHCTEVDETA